MTSSITLPDISALPMRTTDLPEVLDIELYSFNRPWTIEMFKGEMANKNARPIVFRGPEGLLGYVCVWLIADEAHVHNIAVHPKMRRRGLGYEFILHVSTLAEKERMRRMVLDVARGNRAARRLYKKAGFTTIGFRRRYYEDTGEDALIMEKTLR